MERSLKGGLLMGSKRQNNQLELAFGEAVRGEAPSGLARGTEDPMARPAVEGSAAPPRCGGELMEVVVARDNLKEARIASPGNVPGTSSVAAPSVLPLPH